MIENRSFLKIPLSFFKNKDILVIIFILLIVSVFYSPLLQKMNLGFSSVDWYEKYCFEALFRNTILEYHQFPLRSPFFEGGYPTIGHPYDESFNPLSIIILLFGEVIGLKIIIFLIFMISALGMFYLTRHILGYNLLGSFFSTITFILCSWGGCQITEGNYEKLYLYFLPWLLAFFIKSKQDRRFIILSSLVLCIIVIKGVILASVLLFLFLFACLHAIEKQGRKIKINLSYLVIFIIVVGLAFALCAPKILPALELFSEKENFIHFPFEHSYPAISHYAAVITQRALNLNRLFTTLLTKNSYLVDGDDFFQMYLGYIPIILFLASLLIYWKKTFRFLALLIIFTLISFGSNSPVDLFRLLWHLHPFVHYIWKLDVAFSIYIFFIICLIAGRLFLILPKLPKSRFLWICLASIIIFLSINNMFWPNRRFLKDQYGQEIPQFSFQRSFFQVKFRKPIEDSKDDYFYILQNVGVINYCQNILIRFGSHATAKYIVDPGDYRHIANPEGRLELNPNYQGEAFFLEKKNKARIQYSSPNKMKIKVLVRKPGKLIINQNYDQSWRANLGRPSDHEGRLSLDLKKRGVYKVVFTYVPLNFYIGLMISLAAMVCILLFLNSQRKKKGMR